MKKKEMMLETAESRHESQWNHNNSKQYIFNFFKVCNVQKMDDSQF